MQNLVGRKGKTEAFVNEGNTAAAVGSGLLPVYATPQLVALMESAACAAIAEAMPEGSTTVGSHIDVQHLSATPVGLRVWAEATVTEEEGRRLCFAIEAFDEAGSIGKAIHERFIVDKQRFMMKAEAKRNNAI